MNASAIKRAQDHRRTRTDITRDPGPTDPLENLTKYTHRAITRRILRRLPAVTKFYFRDACRPEGMSSYLALERDHKKLNENPLLRYSGSLSSFCDIPGINRFIISNDNNERETNCTFFLFFLSFSVISFFFRKNAVIVIASMQQAILFLLLLYRQETISVLRYSSIKDYLLF